MSYGPTEKLFKIGVAVRRIVDGKRGCVADIARPNLSVRYHDGTTEWRHQRGFEAVDYEGKEKEY